MEDQEYIELSGTELTIPGPSELCRLCGADRPEVSSGQARAQQRCLLTTSPWLTVHLLLVQSQRGMDEYFSQAGYRES
jgi:hypothetical protein